MSTVERIRTRAAVFAALGDVTRLGLVGQLSAAKARSISALAAETRLTRQAVTKHLKVLQQVGLVRPQRVGREQLYVLQPEILAEAEGYLRAVSASWDDALARLQTYLEG
ncbi:MAG: metalloregulator ArsR/SmtB family transcription factor [Paracoccaceae bacterium]